MAYYKDLICPVCGKTFTEEDDVVVCPECGTPHHRVCWMQNGHCAHIDWHSENKVYDVNLEREKIAHEKAETEGNSENTNNSQNQGVFCPRCGFKNEPQALFCSKCGAPVSQGFNNTPNINGPMGQPYMPNFAGVQFVNEEEELEGVKIWKLMSVVKENKLSFFTKFKALAQKAKKASFNFCAFLFSPFYFFYRKMYGLGSALFALTLALNIPSILLTFSNEMLSKAADATITFGFDFSLVQLKALGIASYVASILALAIKILSGVFADRLYFNKCKKMCVNIDSFANNKDDFIIAADKKGGVNRAIIFVFMGIYLVITWASLFFMNSNILGI